MRILVANDDGIQSEGIQELAKYLCKNNDVTVVAPYKNRSAKGHSITVDRGIQIREFKIDNTEIETYTINGSPADCVRVGVEYLMKNKIPDLVISGINDIYNLGNVVVSSGTVAAAREGVSYNIPSIALSINSYKFLNDFIQSLDDLIEIVLRENQKNTVYNINFPSCEKDKVKNIAYTRLSDYRYTEGFVEGEYKGRKSLKAIGVPVYTLEENTDIWAVENNMISITPLGIDMTNYRVLENLTKRQR